MTAPAGEEDFELAIATSLGLAKVPKNEKPDISKLHDAIVQLDDGTPVFVPEAGELVVIEWPGLDGVTWLQTRLYRVKGVNEDNGNIELFDADCDCWAGSNYLTGPQKGLVFKIPTPGWTVSKASRKKMKRKTKDEKLEKPKRKKKD